MMKRIDIVTLSTIASISIIIAILMGLLLGRCSAQEEPLRIVVYDTVYTQMPLTEWEIFQLALIEVESNNDASATSTENARGIFQLTPVYIEQANQLIDADWKPTDAYEDTTAVLIFRLMQDTYNPEHDIDNAIEIHNPGVGKWYANRIYRKMAEIERREQLRGIVSMAL